ncbi:MAG TPA: thioredoxin domain-containing protein [Anaerolineae bacterium]|nr:thioredoxin domain-containing protein [Anaerolineae bacterium]
MRTIKWELIGMLVLVLGLSACGNTPQATPTPTLAPTATSAPVLETPTVAPMQGAALPGAEPLIITTPETLGACEAAPLPVVDVRPPNAEDWGKGASAEKAAYTIIEYSDFQCPGCSGMAAVLDLYIKEHPEVRLIYRHFPLDFHSLAQLAAQAAEAAGAQGKFWEMHDLIFNSQAEWSVLTEEGARAKMSEYAASLALDITRFERELADGTYLEKVQSQYQEGAMMGLPGTPSFIFDDVLFPSDIGLSYESLAEFANLLANRDKFFQSAPEMTVAAADKYIATLTTSQGDIVVELLPESAPTHVNSFVFLAGQQWYDGSEFFFVQSDFVAVTGDPTNTTLGYPGYYCSGEEREFHGQTGLMWMMGNGQFFITLGATAYENMVTAPRAQGSATAQFALIGRVTQGVEVLKKLAVHSPYDATTPADTLETITLARP